jgi:hypothetical protein
MQVAGQTLVQHVPRHVAKAGTDQQRHGDAVKRQTRGKLDEPSTQSGWPDG